MKSLRVSWMVWKVQSSPSIGWALYSRKAYQIQFIRLLPTLKCALLERWPWLDQRQTLFTSSIKIHRGMTEFYSFYCIETFVCLYFLLFCSTIERDRKGILNYNNINTFPNDRSKQFCSELCSVVTNVVFTLFWLWQKLDLLFHFPIADNPGNPQWDGEERGECVSVKWNALYLPREVPALCGQPLKEK